MYDFKINGNPPDIQGKVGFEQLRSFRWQVELSLVKINTTSQVSDTTTHNKHTIKSQLDTSCRDAFTFMLEKEFRNEDPSGKIIAFMLLIVTLTGGGSFAVKLGLQGFPPLKMALFRCILGVIFVGGAGFYYGMSMRMRFKEFQRLLLIAAFYTLHTITLNIGTQHTTAARSTIFFPYTRFLQFCSDISGSQMIGSLKRKHSVSSPHSVACFSPSYQICKVFLQDTSSAISS